MNIGRNKGHVDPLDQTVLPEEHIVYAYSLPEEIWDANTDLHGTPITNGTDTWGNPLKTSIWTFLLKCPHCGTLKIGRSTGFWFSKTRCNECSKIYGVQPDVKHLELEQDEK
jgi:hypothetical protein